MTSTQAKALLTKRKGIASTNQAFVEVILGRPSAKCKHLGICKIESIYSNDTHHNEPTSCPSSKKLFALACYKESDYFELVFERKSIPDTIFKYHFQSGIFKVEETYCTNIDISNSPIMISTGEYNINLSDTLLSIRFQL